MELLRRDAGTCMITMWHSRTPIDNSPLGLLHLVMGVVMIVGEISLPSRWNLDNMGMVKTQIGKGLIPLGCPAEILDGVGQTGLLYNEGIFTLIISSMLVLLLLVVFYGYGMLPDCKGSGNPFSFFQLWLSYIVSGVVRVVTMFFILR